MSYVDIAIYAVPTANKTQFISHAEQVAPLFKKNGALAVADCWGDEVPPGELTSLPLAVKCESNETVAFSYIIWPSKEVRDQGMQQAMGEMQAQMSSNPMPFDGKRMIFGSFQPVVEL